MGAGEDRISSLPDELLHDILVRLRSARAGVRTSVLSLRVAPLVVMSFLEQEVDGEAVLLELPACEGATTIHLSLEGTCRLRAPSAVLFRELTNLTMLAALMEGSELTTLVCTQCPCLRDLRISIMLVNVFNVSIRSNSLRSLWLSVRKTQQLEIVAPRLEKLEVSAPIDEARISAPKLAEVDWSCITFDPCRHHFDDVGRPLRLLELGPTSTVASLSHQFDDVDELTLNISISQGTAGFKSFLKKTNKVPKCKVFSISLTMSQHRLVPAMFHLLRSCSSTRKVSLHDFCFELRLPCQPSCPCHVKESHMIDDISLSSLEEVEISSYTSSHEVMEFVEQLPKCNVAALKKVVIKHCTDSLPPPTKEVCEKFRSMYKDYKPDIEVEFYALLGREWVCLD